MQVRAVAKFLGDNDSAGPCHNFDIAVAASAERGRGGGIRSGGPDPKGVILTLLLERGILLRHKPGLSRIRVPLRRGSQTELPPKGLRNRPTPRMEPFIFSRADFYRQIEPRVKGVLIDISTNTFCCKYLKSGSAVGGPDEVWPHVCVSPILEEPVAAGIRDPPRSDSPERAGNGSVTTHALRLALPPSHGLCFGPSLSF